MKLNGSIVFVTGANRGIGLAFARQARDLGAAKVYAGMRNTAGFSEPGLTPIQLDVTDPASIARAVQAAGDVTLLVNNAGAGIVAPTALDPAVEEQSRAMFDTNYFGIVRLTQAFAPVLKKSSESAVINVLTSLTWLPAPFLTAYSASKAAAWSFTNNVRPALKEQNTAVIGLHVHFVDTDLTKGVDVPKENATDVAREAFEALEAGKSEVFVGDVARAAKASLSNEVPLYINPNQAS